MVAARILVATFWPKTSNWQLAISNWQLAEWQELSETLVEKSLPNSSPPPKFLNPRDLSWFGKRHGKINSALESTLQKIIEILVILGKPFRVNGFGVPESLYAKF